MATVRRIETTSTESYVREAFKDAPILIKIAECESTFRQFNDDGTVLLGQRNPDDVGVMQINKRYHLEDSKKLGLDINTLEGNVKYAMHLYKTQGTQPWFWSRPCWSAK